MEYRFVCWMQHEWKQQCRLIICQVSSSRCEIVNTLTSVFSLVALSSLFFPFMGSIELVSIRILALIMTISHIHYAVCVVQQMCDHFRINCLSLKKREVEISREHLLSESQNSLNDLASNQHFKAMTMSRGAQDAAIG